MKIHLLVIDPQIDFCRMDGALFVNGATEDMLRLATMIDRIGPKLQMIHATLDSHHLVDIAHPIFWANSKGEHPQPFTIITADDVANGIWFATIPSFRKRAEEYVKALAANGRYPLCIWPPHCLIGSLGYAVLPELFEAFRKWEAGFRMVDYVTKGSNYWTEHYSAVQADVPDPSDPGTQLNMGLIQTLQDADEILLGGEARSHCLANTVTDIANNFGEENIKKMVLLEDATSDVSPNPPGTTLFTDMGEGFVKEMTGRGMRISTTTKYLR
jgi:nicotinamidase/pyrazinamidase